MYRVLPLLLMFGLIAFAPLSLPAQDKDKDKDAKVDDKKADDKKADDKKAEEKPPEVPVVKKGEDKPTVYEITPPTRLDLALSYVPFISLVLIAVLFMLVLSLRSAVSQLEEKIKGGS